MEEGIKNRIILILAIVTVLFFIMTVSSCIDTQKQKKLKEQEMATRLDLEEKMTKSSQVKVNLEEGFKKCQQTLEEEKAQGEVTRKALVQEQLINKSLKEELEKVTKLKEALEEDLKEALVGKSSKGKK